MTPEQFTAIVGLGGVALGIGGTLIAARVQLQGSQAQAEATRRAAETTAVTQYAATLIQQNRAAQRAAYVALLDTSNRFTREVERATGKEEWTSEDDVRELMRQLHKAFSSVELEGPPPVMEAAEMIIEWAETLALYIDNSTMKEYRAWGKIRHAVSHQESAAVQAVEALEALRLTTRTIPGSAIREMRDSIDMVATTQSLGAIGEAWRQAYAVAQVKLEPLRMTGALESQETDDLLRDAGTRQQAIDTTIHYYDARTHSAVYQFVGAARQHLNDTNPEHLSDRAHPMTGEPFSGNGAAAPL